MTTTCRGASTAYPLHERKLASVSTPVEPRRTLPLGGLIADRYRLVRKIADGGMGTVWLAIDDRLGRRVAVKVLPPGSARDEAQLSRFRREGQLAAGLSHPTIVAVHDLVEEHGQVCLVMEYVEGHTLRQWIDHTGALPVREAVRIFTAILRALAVAHTAGLIHRDVKPENVLIASDGSVKVTDFGLAREASTLTRTDVSHVLGSVPYLAPEQLRRKPADERSDVYAAGLILVDLLTGRRAMEGASEAQIAAQHVSGSVPLASERVSTVPLEMDRLIARATAIDPDDRPATASEFLDELREATRQLSEAELDATPVYEPGMAPTLKPLVPLVAERDPSADTAVLETLTATAKLEVTPPGATTTVLPVGAVEHAPVTTPIPQVWGNGTSPSDPGAPAVGVSAGSPTPPHPDRRRRRVWPFLLVLALLAGGAAGGWWWYDSAGPGAQRLVPPLVHLTEAQATAALAGVELRADVGTAYSETEPKGQVIEAQPAAGAQVRRNTAVRLIVSLGQERYAVPKLVDVKASDVAALLADRRLVAGPATEEFSETVPAGVVIRQDPPPDASVKRDTPVAVVVSKGREPLPVTSFVGKPADDAQRLLEAAGFTVVRGEPVNSETVPEGAVVTQTPSQGTLFRKDTVTLIVSKGPVLVAVPDVTLKQQAVAEKILKDAGFAVTINKLFGGALKTVRFQDPGAGTMLRRGSTITLTII